MRGKKFISLLLLFIAVNSVCYLNANTNDTIKKEHTLKWFEFHWLNNHNYFNLDVEKAHMLIDVRFGGHNASYPLFFRLMAFENLMYNRTKESLLWHYPFMESEIVSRQSAGRSVIEHFPDIDIMFGSSRVKFGTTEFKVVPDPIRTKHNAHMSSVGGILSPEIFLDKVLFIDFPNKKMAFDEKIPDDYLSKGSFTRFIYARNYITIPIVVYNRTYWFWVSENSPPAIEIFHKKLYDRIVSYEAVNDSLLAYGERNVPMLVAGHKPKEDFFLGDLKLNEQNIYYVDKGNTRYNRRRIIGMLSLACFFDYIVVIDYKNQVFGLIPN